MSSYEDLEELLKKYKFNKARKIFLENQINRITSETHNDYIEGKMFMPGYSGKTPKFIIEDNEEIAQLNKVEETAYEYMDKCCREYNQAISQTQRELNELSYYIAIVEDGLKILGRVNEKYKVIIENYYINNSRMEDIADSIHISRSRCYELCKEALKWMTRVVYGENTMLQ